MPKLQNTQNVRLPTPLATISGKTNKHKLATIFSSQPISKQAQRMGGYRSRIPLRSGISTFRPKPKCIGGYNAPVGYGTDMVTCPLEYDEPDLNQSLPQNQTGPDLNRTVKCTLSNSKAQLEYHLWKLTIGHALRALLFHIETQFCNLGMCAIRVYQCEQHRLPQVRMLMMRTHLRGDEQTFSACVNRVDVHLQTRRGWCLVCIIARHNKYSHSEVTKHTFSMQQW